MHKTVGIDKGSAKRPKHKLYALLLATVVAFACPAGVNAQSGGEYGPPPALPPVDLLLVNGHILTPTGWREAVAISQGVIVATGDNIAVRTAAGGHGRTIDLGGRTVLPGFHDAHLHSLTGGLMQFECRMKPHADVALIKATLAGCVTRAQKGKWIRGGDWVGAAFKDGEQTKSLLDQIAPDNPVFLTDESHHSAWVNSRALAIAGITRDTASPPGGIIERDAAGEPTGVLRERAAAMVAGKIPPPDENMRRQALENAATQMLGYGITSFTDAGTTSDFVATLADLSAEGRIKQHIRTCLRYAPPPVGAVQARSLVDSRLFFARPRMQTDCVKIVLDGVPTESRTAALLAPYDHQHERGLTMVDQAALDAAVIRFDRAGLSVKFHASGDAAVRSALEAVAAARKANGRGGPMHSVAHANLVDSRDIGKAGPLGVAWEFSPYVWYPTPVVAVDVAKAVGSDRMKRWMPIREALDSGALVVVGSDWSVVPSLNPWLAIETLVTRQMPGGSRDTIGEGQRITLAEAIRMYTESAAMEMGLRAEQGSIEPGMRADLIVLDRDPFAIPSTELHLTTVLQTFIDGAVVYDRSVARSGARD